jgi:hypothetical protein
MQKFHDILFVEIHVEGVARCIDGALGVWNDNVTDEGPLRVVGCTISCDKQPISCQSIPTV